MESTNGGAFAGEFVDTPSSQCELNDQILTPAMLSTLPRLDRFILETACEYGGLCPCDVIVGDDPDGVLTDAVLTHMGTYQSVNLYVASRDRYQAAYALLAAAERGLQERVIVAGVDGPLYLPDFFDEHPVEADFVLTHLPKSLEELEYLARSVAGKLSRRRMLAGEIPTMTFIGGGNTKHMTRRQNEVLAGVARSVHATRGSGKFRCLVAKHPAEQVRRYRPPRTETEAGTIWGIGGVFGGASEDHGGRMLTGAAIRLLRGWVTGDDADASPPAPLHVLDLGCGNGQVSLGVLHALRDHLGSPENPALHVTATDVAADAVVSAQRTLKPYDAHATVTWGDAAKALPGESVDVVLLNPPFHEGAAVDASLADNLVAAAARVLRPGGVLLLVHNSHLRYRPLVGRTFGGPSALTEVARDRRFTVLRAQK